MSNVRALAPVERLSTVDTPEVDTLAGRIVPLFPKECNREQALIVARVALAYGLDPLTKEVVPFQGLPYITIAGRWRIANENPAYDGEETVPATEAERRALGAADNELVWRCSVYRKDRSRPAVAWGRAGGKDETNPVARRWAAEIAIKRAQHRALRAAFPCALPNAPEIRDDGFIFGDDPATPEQIKAIHAIDREAGVSDGERHMVLEATYAVGSSRDLTSAQASAYMDERTVADAQTPIEPPADGPLSKLTQKQAAAIKDHVLEHGYSAMDIRGWMAHHDFTRWSEMTEADGDAMKRDAINGRRPWEPEPPIDATGELIGDDFDAEDADGVA